MENISDKWYCAHRKRKEPVNKSLHECALEASNSLTHTNSREEDSKEPRLLGASLMGLKTTHGQIHYEEETVLGPLGPSKITQGRRSRADEPYGFLSANRSKCDIRLVEGSAWSLA